MSRLDDIEDRLSCGLCMEVYDELLHVPKLLHCAHTLCKECLQNVISSQKAKFFPCPFCREDIPVLKSNRYRSNISVIDMMHFLKCSDDIKKRTDESGKRLQHGAPGCFENSRNIFSINDDYMNIGQASSLNKNETNQNGAKIATRSNQRPALNNCDDTIWIKTDPGKCQINSTIEEQIIECAEHHEQITCICQTCEVNLCTKCLLLEMQRPKHSGHQVQSVNPVRMNKRVLHIDEIPRDETLLEKARSKSDSTEYINGTSNATKSLHRRFSTPEFKTENVRKSVLHNKQIENKSKIEYKHNVALETKHEISSKNSFNKDGFCLDVSAKGDSCQSPVASCSYNVLNTSDLNRQSDTRNTNPCTSSQTSSICTVEEVEYHPSEEELEHLATSSQTSSISTEEEFGYHPGEKDLEQTNENKHECVSDVNDAYQISNMISPNSPCMTHHNVEENHPRRAPCNPKNDVVDPSLEHIAANTRAIENDLSCASSSAIVSDMENVIYHHEESVSRHHFYLPANDINEDTADPEEVDVFHDCPSGNSFNRNRSHSSMRNSSYVVINDDDDEGLLDLVSSEAEPIIEEVQEIVGEVVDDVSEVLSDVKDTVSEIYTCIQSEVASTVTEWYNLLGLE